MLKEKLVSSSIFTRLLHSVQHRVRRHYAFPGNHAATSCIGLRLSTNIVRLIFSPCLQCKYRANGERGCGVWATVAFLRT